jgi:hypothetical protein
LTFAGTVRVGVPPNPVSPLRVVHTRLVDVVGTGAGVSCAARGAAHFRVTPEGTVEFTGTYNLVPPNPIQPGDPAEACWGNRLSVAYTITFDAEGNVVGQSQ